MKTIPTGNIPGARDRRRPQSDPKGSSGTLGAPKDAPGKLERPPPRGGPYHGGGSGIGTFRYGMGLCHALIACMYIYTYMCIYTYTYIYIYTYLDTWYSLCWIQRPQEGRGSKRCTCAVRGLPLNALLGCLTESENKYLFVRRYTCI